MSKVAIPRALAELWRFAGTDISRKALMAVQFGTYNGLQFAAATDGHRLMEATVRSHLDPQVSALIPAAILKAVCRAAGRGKNAHNIVIDAETRMIEVGTQAFGFEAPDPTLPYPDWRSIPGVTKALAPPPPRPSACKDCGHAVQITSSDQPCCPVCRTVFAGLVECTTCHHMAAPRHDPHVGIDACYVGDIGDYLKALGLPPNVTMRLDPVSSAAEPVWFEAEDHVGAIDFRGLVMPVR